MFSRIHLPSCWVSGLLLVALTLGIFGMVNVFPDRADAKPGVAAEHRRPLPMCTVEDASSGPVPCVWLANDYGHMPAAGNGIGTSFRVFKDGRYRLITDRRAWQLLHGLPTHDRSVA